MEEEKIIEVLMQRCVEKENKTYITCETAFQIAEELDLDASIIGRLCNQHGIKIKSCMLGYF